MRRYVQVSGAFFFLLAAAQLTRALFRWRVQVADATVPVWVSVLVFLVASSFALWAFRAARSVA